MPCSAPSRNNLKVQGPCGFETYLGNLCKPHWQMANGLPPALDGATALLLHCEGPDASNQFVDAAGHPVQAVAGAKCSTAQKQFGCSSLLVPGAATT